MANSIDFADACSLLSSGISKVLSRSLSANFAWDAALCQGRSKTRPLGRSKSRPVEYVEDLRFVGEEGVGSGGPAPPERRRVLGRSGRRPPPRGVFAAAVSGRQLRRAVGGSGVRL